MKNKYGLVLAGGGGKGAYQIGAWKALRELGIKFSAVAGTSIGSINGALICADDYDKALAFWEKISPKYGIKIINELPDQENLFSTKNWTPLFRELVKNKGIDASPAKDFIAEFVDEEKVRKSKIPLGIVTVSRKQGIVPMEVFIDEIPQGELITYLLASSSVPGVSNIAPEGEKYWDGGIHDNLPISFLRKNGYNKIIVLDISNVKGFAHTLDIDNCEIIYIRPYSLEDLGPAFAFEQEYIDRRIEYGYLDTRKAFSYLNGKIYYFEPKVFREMIAQYGADTVLQLELLAHDLSVDRLKIYEKDEFVNLIYEKYQEEKERYEVKQENNEIEKIYTNFVKKLVNRRNEDEFKLAIEVMEKMQSFSHLE